ncbi:MAG TPA: pyrophosphate--fructose-6-phosphate 1-phosphotransferase [Jiangellaceae bacterium]|nr:pyrophosphate--fructose-6-phosphate 1-phosphotransferase [Jiangellaceae bacterium]
MTVRKVAMLTAGGLAPCLSSAIGGLIERYTDTAPEVELIGYRNGYAGLLAGRSVEITPEVRERAHLLHRFGGSPLGNSRVKLTNVADLVERGLIDDGQDPLAMAADRLTQDGVDVLHTIGGDDTNTMAAELAAYLDQHGYALTVVGLPKTVDNDIVPVKQSLGAWTAADQGALFARNIVAEHSSNPRMLVVHEVMGRHCGWLTAATARVYRAWLSDQEWNPGIGLDAGRWDVHGVFVPEVHLDIDAEADRLRGVMDELGCVNIFVSEGAGVESIVAELEESGEEVPRDPFGHVQLDKVNPGAWFGEQLSGRLGAEKVMVQKSGYFSRSAAPNDDDLGLIRSCTEFAVQCALSGEAGVVGQDEEHAGQLRAIEFDRIKGGKRFDPAVRWYADMLAEIAQPAN